MFDPSQPFTADDIGAAAQVPFDPNKPFVADNPTVGALKAGGMGALEALPFGGQAAGVGEAGLNTLKGQPFDYSKGMTEAKAANQELSAEHPIAHAVGTGLGLAAPLAIPGVGEENLATRLGVNAALGAGYGLGDIDVSKDPKEALKQAAEGAGTAAGVGEALRPLAQGAEEFANRKAVQGANIPSAKLGKTPEQIQDLGTFIRDTVGIGQNADERAAAAKNMLQHFGEQVGGLGESAKGSLTLTGKNAHPIIANLQQAAEDSAKTFGPRANPELTTYRQALAGIQHSDGSFNALQQLKEQWGSRAFDSMGNPKDAAALNVYKELSSAQEDLLKTMPEDYRNAKQGYSMMKDIAGNAKSSTGVLGRQAELQSGKDTGVKGFGLAGKLSSMLGMHPAAYGVMGAAAAAAGHPLIGAGLSTPILMNPNAMAKIGEDISKYAPRAVAPITGATKELMDYFAQREKDDETQ
jgi:hypothetical protein